MVAEAAGWLRGVETREVGVGESEEGGWHGVAETIRTLRRQRSSLPPPQPLSSHPQRSPPCRKNAVKARLRALSLAEPAPNERDIAQIATTKRRATSTPPGERERERSEGNSWIRGERERERQTPAGEHGI